MKYAIYQPNCFGDVVFLKNNTDAGVELINCGLNSKLKECVADLFDVVAIDKYVNKIATRIDSLPDEFYSTESSFVIHLKSIFTKTSILFLYVYPDLVEFHISEDVFLTGDTKQDDLNYEKVTLFFSRLKKYLNLEWSYFEGSGRRIKIVKSTDFFKHEIWQSYMTVVKKSCEAS